MSLIIPMYNEEAFVARCLDSILGQLQGRTDVEIFCVDGASTDGTRAIVLEYVRRDPRVRLLENPHRIIPRSLNLAIRQAVGEWIFRLDCHSEYADDYLESCIRVAQRTGAEVVGGYLQTEPSRDSLVGRAIAAATSSRFGVGGSRARLTGPECETDIVPFGCFSRKVFSRFGLYDERFVRNQDIELFSRIRRGGGKIVVSPEIRLTYYNQATFRGLWAQSFRNGQWNPYQVYLVRRGLSPRHFAPLACVLGGLLGLLAGFFESGAWLILSGLLLTYTVVGLIVARRVAGPKNTASFLVFLAFLQLHLSYGLGSLWGLVSAPFRFGSAGFASSATLLKEKGTPPA